VKQLEAANGNLESFSYSVAHDLRAPLRSMAGFSQLLEMDLDDGKFDDVKDHLRRIMESAAKMNALIDGLLHVAHAGHGKFAIERIDTGEMLEGVLNELGVRERAQVTVGQMPEVRADPAALRQVWVNLVSNAVKYSAKRHQQEISIACETQGSEFVFCVRDNGSGFNPDDAARLFGVFSRLHSARDYEGIGVGLAIVKRVVERHGGRVWAESKPDEGATFHFTIPVAPAA
jgi:light-regulated signal transduction histidine kinase (bacteriophytochrome)